MRMPDVGESSRLNAPGSLRFIMERPSGLAVPCSLWFRLLPASRSRSIALLGALVPVELLAPALDCSLSSVSIELSSSLDAE